MGAGKGKGNPKQQNLVKSKTKDLKSPSKDRIQMSGRMQPKSGHGDSSDDDMFERDTSQDLHKITIKNPSDSKKQHKSKEQKLKQQKSDL